MGEGTRLRTRPDQEAGRGRVEPGPPQPIAMRQHDAWHSGGANRREESDLNRPMPAGRGGACRALIKAAAGPTGGGGGCCSGRCRRGVGSSSAPLGPGPFSSLVPRQLVSPFLGVMTTTTTFKGVDPNSRNSSR